MAFNIREAKVGEFILQCSDELGADLVLGVVFLEIVAFLHTGVTADG